MKSSPLIYSLILLIALILILPYSEAQYQYYDFGNYYNPYFTPFAQHKNDNYFRSGLQQPHPSYDPRKVGGAAAASVSTDLEDRFFFTTVKVTITTSTLTSTITSTTVCTTSTTTLKSCTPSGRRRRGMSLDKEGRAAGLFYEEEEGEDGSIFLIPAPKE